VREEGRRKFLSFGHRTAQQAPPPPAHCSTGSLVISVSNIKVAARQGLGQLDKRLLDLRQLLCGGRSGVVRQGVEENKKKVEKVKTASEAKHQPTGRQTKRQTDRSTHLQDEEREAVRIVVSGPGLGNEVTHTDRKKERDTHTYGETHRQTDTSTPPG
jgi:hypothetical protein